MDTHNASLQPTYSVAMNVAEASRFIGQAVANLRINRSPFAPIDIPPTAAKDLGNSLAEIAERIGATDPIAIYNSFREAAKTYATAQTPPIDLFAEQKITSKNPMLKAGQRSDLIKSPIPTAITFIRVWSAFCEKYKISIAAIAMAYRDNATKNVATGATNRIRALGTNHNQTTHPLFSAMRENPITFFDRLANQAKTTFETADVEAVKFSLAAIPDRYFMRSGQQSAGRS